MRKTLLLAFQGWFMSKEQHLLKNYLINQSLNLWWYSYRTAKRVKTVPPGTTKFIVRLKLMLSYTLCTIWWLIKPWQQHLWKVQTVPEAKTGTKCCKIGPKFWPNQKGVGNFRSQWILRFLGLLSPNLKLVFCQKFFLAHKWNCCFCLSATVYPSNVMC